MRACVYMYHQNPLPYYLNLLVFTLAYLDDELKFTCTDG